MKISKPQNVKHGNEEKGNVEAEIKKNTHTIIN